MSAHNARTVDQLISSSVSLEMQEGPGACAHPGEGNLARRCEAPISGRSSLELVPYLQCRTDYDPGGGHRQRCRCGSISPAPAGESRRLGGLCQAAEQYTAGLLATLVSPLPCSPSSNVQTGTYATSASMPTPCHLQCPSEVLGRV